MANGLNDLEEAYMDYIVGLTSRCNKMRQGETISSKQLRDLLENSFKNHHITHERFQKLSGIPRSKSMMTHEVRIAVYFSRVKPQPTSSQAVELNSYYLGRYLAY